MDQIEFIEGIGFGNPIPERYFEFMPRSLGRSSIHLLFHSLLLGAACLFFFLLTGCTNQPIPVTPTATAIPPTETKIYVPKETSIPPGSSDNPLVIAHILTSNPTVAQDSGQSMVDFIENETGYSLVYEVYDDPKSAFEKLRKGEVDFIWLQPLTYLAAYQRDLVSPLFVSNHFGLYKYGTQFLANKSSGFIQYFDTGTNRITTTEEFALQQFEGKRPCWTEPSSLSGTITPFGLLARNGIQILPPAYTQSHSSSVRALYIKGICDFAAVFAYSGDPRTSSAVINDLPDALEQIIIIWRSDPIIPSLSFHASTKLSPDIVEKVAAAMLKLSKSEDGNEILTQALDYDFQGMIPIDNDYFALLSDLVRAANVVPYQHLGY